jgi:hypothetical protein
VFRLRGWCRGSEAPCREGSTCESVDLHQGERRDVDQLEVVCTPFLQVAGKGRGTSCQRLTVLCRALSESQAMPLDDVSPYTRSRVLLPSPAPARDFATRCGLGPFEFVAAERVYFGEAVSWCP